MHGEYTFEAKPMGDHIVIKLWRREDNMWDNFSSMSVPLSQYMFASWAGILDYYMRLMSCFSSTMGELRRIFIVYKNSGGLGNEFFQQPTVGQVTRYNYEWVHYEQKMEWTLSDAEQPQ